MSKKNNILILKADDPKGENLKQTILRQLLSTPGGRRKLATSMTMPLKTRQDYSGIARKIFSVEPLSTPNALGALLKK